MSIFPSIDRDELGLRELLQIGLSGQEGNDVGHSTDRIEVLSSGFFLEEPHTRPSYFKKIRLKSSLQSKNITRIVGGAAPIMPLRERDSKALANFFEPADMDEIEADIVHNLIWLWPEPCWEDDPFDFLREYL